jgi:putative glycosyltransferase (TIGR04348 family)
MLRALGHRVQIRHEYCSEGCDLVVALHANKSASSILRSFEERPRRPIILALTGTDLYRDLPESAAARSALDMAWRIIVLQPMALGRIPQVHHSKTRVIYQSAVPTRESGPKAARCFDIAVSGHLRDEKDPLLAAAAARLLPASSRVRVLQIGRALTAEYASRARREEAENPRYRWLRELSRRESRRVVARSRALALTSTMEGGANVISEAIVDGVPIIGSRVDGTVGLLGAGYPGLFPVGDTESLARLMSRIESDESFRSELRDCCAKRRALFEPERELESWRELVCEIVV